MERRGEARRGEARRRVGRVRLCLVRTVADSDALEIDLFRRHLVALLDCVRDGGHILSGIALSRGVEIIRTELRRGGGKQQRQGGWSSFTEVSKKYRNARGGYQQTLQKRMGRRRGGSGLGGKGGARAGVFA